MTGELLYQADAYRQDVEAAVVTVEDRNVVLDRTVFYPQGGGQPGDTGKLNFDGTDVSVALAQYSKDRTKVLHVLGPEGSVPKVGQSVRVRIDWPLRFARMRVHTALHLLTAVLPYPVTGGAIGDGEGRLDFAIPDAALEKTDIEVRLQAHLDITDEELSDNPGLVKTMSVKPPMGSGKVRLVAIGDIDLQPCGGTHVAWTREIGRVAVTGIESKGRQNRRVRIAVASLDPRCEFDRGIL